MIFIAHIAFSAYFWEMSNGIVTTALLCHRYSKKVTPFRYSLLQKKSNAVPLPLPEKVTALVTPLQSNAVTPSTEYNHFIHGI